MNEEFNIIKNFIEIIQSEKSINKMNLIKIYQEKYINRRGKDDIVYLDKKIKEKDIHLSDIYLENINGNVEYMFTGQIKNNAYAYNKIYFGPPGSGKSYKIKEILKNEKNIFRVTFFDEYSYYDFVGQYKPVVLKDYSSKISTKIDQRDSEKEPSPVISYEFIPGIFMKSYVKSYNYPEEKIFLIIEEINRGNCSSIFGDIFQLLDRDKNGSKYPIQTTVEIKKYLKDNIKNKDEIFYDELIIPNNLYILSTMNTSDQSLFPIDSAFKRRWKQEYCPINYEEQKLFNIKIENTNIRWLDFIKKMNQQIFSILKNEDKQIGQWFVEIEENNIKTEDFIYKVVAYLYYDVFKHYRDIVFENMSFDQIINNDNKRIIGIMLKNE